MAPAVDAVALDVGYGADAAEIKVALDEGDRQRTARLDADVLSSSAIFAVVPPPCTGTSPPLK
jgi:hypothetical protein